MPCLFPFHSHLFLHRAGNETRIEPFIFLFCLGIPANLIHHSVDFHLLFVITAQTWMSLRLMSTELDCLLEQLCAECTLPELLTVLGGD